MSISIRAGGRDDLAAVLALWATCAATPSSTDDVAGLETLLDRDPDALLLAELDGSLVGTLIAGFDGWRGTMYRIVVADGARRQGIAGALVRAGEQRLRVLGVRRLNANIVAVDAQARGFWESAGYEHDPAMARFVKNF